jgi:hypothetical protein
MKPRAGTAAALAICVYLGALDAPFIFDDHHTIVDNPSIRDLGNLRWIVIGSRRVVTNLSYAVDWALWGPRPFGFHLTNLCLHALVVVALFGLARRLRQNDASAFLTAALLAVHPLASESVAYLSSRAGLLCALFLVTSTWAWHRALTERRAWAAPAALLWVMAAGSKESGLLAPLLWLACDVCFVERPWRRRLVWYLPPAALGLVAGAWRIHSFIAVEGGHGPTRLWTQAEVWWRYLFLWFVPVGLSLVHASGSTPLAWLSLVSLPAALWLLFRLPAPARFGGLWFLILLLPSSVLPLMQPMAEHRVYEALAGAALASALLLEKLPRPKLAAALVLALLGTATVLRVQLWRQPAELWEDAARKAPREWLARYGLGEALRQRGEFSRAAGEYTVAMSLKPGDPRARRNRAICWAHLGRLDEAEAELMALLAQAPKDATLHYNLGLLERQRGQLEAARTHWLEALEQDPSFLKPCEGLRQLPGKLPPVCPEAIR